MNIRMTTIKRGLLFFWAGYYTIVCFTNLLDAFKAHDLLPVAWNYVSGNFAMIQNVVNIASFPGVITSVLYFGVILWEGIIAILFWRALVQYNNADFSKVNTAFAMSIALTAAFILVVEGFIAFEKINIMIFFSLLLTSLLSLLAIRVLPEER